MIARLLTAIQDNAVLREDFLSRVIQPQTQDKHDLIKAAIAAGDLPANTDIPFFLDILFGPLIGRLLKHQGVVDDAFVSAVFDHVVAGARALAAEKA